MSDVKDLIIVLDAKGSTGVGVPVNVSDYQHAIFSLASDGGGDAAATIKFQGSIQDTLDPPAFGSAQSVTNHWDYIEVVDLEDGAAIDGDTGVAWASADDYRLMELNVNGLSWVNVSVTARTAGEITVKVRLFNHNK